MTKQELEAKTAALSAAALSAMLPLKAAGKEEQFKSLKQRLDNAVVANTTILVCGEFKRGKSSFINALIGRNLCPTDTDICTSAASIIKYGPQPKATRYFGDFTNVKSESIDTDELEDYAVGSAAEIDNTLYIEIEMPLDALKEGVTIIDTPGVGGLDPRHAALTNHFLPRADVSVFMTDVNEPLSSTELEFFRDRVLRYSPYSVIVVNKSDLKDAAQVEEIKQDTARKLVDYAGEKAASVQCIAVSSVAEMVPDFGDSNFGALRTHIQNLVAESRMQELKLVHADLLELAALAIAPLEAQLAQIESPDANRMRELTARKNELDSRFADLTNPSSPFRNEINAIINNKREEMLNMLTASSANLMDAFSALIKSEQASEENGGKWVGSRLNDLIAEVSSQVTLDLNSMFSQIAAMPLFEGALNFSARGFSATIQTRNIEKLPVHKRILAGMGGVGLATIGTHLLSNFLFPGFGLIFSGIAGAMVSSRNIGDTVRGHTEQQLRQAYAQQINSAITNLRTYIDMRFQEFQREWLRVVTEKAEAYRTSVQESMAAIKQVQQDIARATNTKVALEAKIKPFKKAKAELEVIQF